MQNYSEVFAATLDEFVSPIVPGDQGDAGKGQVTARAVYTIHTTIDRDVGYISKNPGQTQYHGIAVDACLDRLDGTGADYLTDELQPDGTRLIKLAYTPYPPPAPGTPLPPANWVEPTPDMLDKGGPLTLKAAQPPVPEPVPPADNAEVLQRLDTLEATLLARLDTLEANILARDDANTEKIQTQIHDLVEDAEETLLDIALLMIVKNRPGSKSEQTAAASTRLQKRVDERQRRGGESIV